MIIQFAVQSLHERNPQFYRNYKFTLKLKLLQTTGKKTCSWGEGLAIIGCLESLKY